jgi:hypothetical protein
LQPVANDPIHVALRQPRAVVALGRQRQDLDDAVRRLLLDLRDQLRQEQGIKEIAGGKTEGLARAAGLEPARVGKHRLRGTKNACAGGEHAQAGVGGHHAGA